jgi:hypothetical protein
MPSCDRLSATVSSVMIQCSGAAMGAMIAKAAGGAHRQPKLA